MRVPKRVLVCGVGSIGKRHVANLLKLGAEVSVWRSRKKLLSEFVSENPVSICEDISTGIIAADAVVVSTATDCHMGIAMEALQVGCGLYLEKPISNSWSGVEELIELGKNKTVEVGCQFRAHPSLATLAKIFSNGEEKLPLTYRLTMGYRLDAWRPNQDYRHSYSTHSERGGGALFDLIHQIDLALWFFGSIVSVNAVLSKVSDLEISGDDVANILLTHNSGITGHIQLDMCSPVNRCEAEVIATESVFRWSNADGILRSFSRYGENVIQEVPPDFERNDLFLIHMGHFLKRLDEPMLPAMCSLESGAEAIKVALAARESDTKRISVNL